MVPLVGQSPTVLPARPQSQTNFASFNIAWSSFRGYTHTHTHTHTDTYKPLNTLSVVIFPFTGSQGCILGCCTGFWIDVVTHGKWCLNLCVHVCVCVWVPIACVSMRVYMCMGICMYAWIFPGSTGKRCRRTPFSAVLPVINHAATLIYVPLLVALSFILGGRISPSRSSGETASACSIHIAF